MDLINRYFAAWNECACAHRFPGSSWFCSSHRMGGVAGPPGDTPELRSTSTRLLSSHTGRSGASGKRQILRKPHLGWHDSYEPTCRTNISLTLSESYRLQDAKARNNRATKSTTATVDESTPSR